MDSSLFESFSAVFNKAPDKIGISTQDYIDYSYQDILNTTAQMANALNVLGVKEQDVVAVQVEKSVYNIFLYLACLQSNIIYLPFNPQYTINELSYFISDAKPKLFVCDPTTRESIQQLISKTETLDANGLGSLRDLCDQQHKTFTSPTVRESDIAALLYTSGTTGKPKGAMLSQQAMKKNALAINQVWEMNEQDTVLHSLPLYHSHGLFFALHTTLLAGARLLFLSKFESNVVISHLMKSTVFMGIPTYYTRLLNNPDFGKECCQTIRIFTSGSAPLLASTFDDFKKATGHCLVERYGMTETGVNASNPLHGEKKIGSVGIGLPGVNIRVADDEGQILSTGDIGNIQIKGENLFSGYLNLPEKTKQSFSEDGYFTTGDLGFLDNEGYLSIVGRQSDLIISGGLNVYPKEIEIVIDTIEGVLESAVIGVPHPDFVEAVVAVVIKKDNTENLTDNIIIQHLKTYLAHFKIPKKIFFAESLPRNAMGKVQKSLLRTHYEKTFS